MKINRLGITLFTAASVIVVNTAPTIAQSNAGIEFESSGTLNQTAMVQNWVNHETTYRDTGVQYKSETCGTDERQARIPSDVYGPTVLVSDQAVTPYRSGQPRTKAFFRSAKTLPAEGLRVVIRNHSIGGGETPYADREYEESNKSEKFFVSPESEHKSKYLAIQNGENRMSYEIRRGKQVLESGEFVANITIADRYITRTTTHPPTTIEVPCIQKSHHEHHKKHNKDRHHAYIDHDHNRGSDRPIYHEVRNPIFDQMP